MNHEREAYMLGALLHDIGKFVQRAQPSPKIKDHCKWGDQWFENHLAEKLSSVLTEKEKEIVRKSINDHHAHFPYIHLADSISASMDRIALEDEETGSPFTDRLISIFSRLSISLKEKKEYYHHLGRLGNQSLKETFPLREKSCTVQEYSSLLGEFNEQIKSLSFRSISPLEAVDRLYFILWKYTWCIPSAAYQHHPDIPLFDHLKTTAAMTACLYDYHNAVPGKSNVTIDDQAFFLVAGDISGIQSFLFEVLTQQGKVAKRLRARSFFIQLISEVASHKILHTFGLPICNILSSAGGNFYILVPNTAKAENSLRQLQESFDKWLYDNYKGEIFLSISWSKASGTELSVRVDRVFEDTHRRLQSKKYRPFESVLRKGNVWLTQNVLFEGIKGEDEVCTGCRKRPVSEKDWDKVDEEERLCASCQADIDMGKRLTTGKYIAFFNDDDHDYKFFDYSVEIWKDFRPKNDAYLVLELNSTANPGLGFKLMVTHIPKAEDVKCAIENHEHEPESAAFFDCIAGASEGDMSLGYVKADVDNMGVIIKYGFHPTDPKGKQCFPGMKPSISRFCCLSRMMEAFFGGVIQSVMEDEFSDLYAVFSGGDDFFILGPWNRTIEFARKIRKKFEEFTGFNPDMSFSAGIIFAKPHEPISFCAEEASRMLELSKNTSTKDKITLFNHVLSWDDVDLILSEASKIIAWIDDEQLIARAFAYRLKKYGEMARESKIYEVPKKEIDTAFLKFVPMLIYDINRNLNRPEQAKPFNWAKNLVVSREQPTGGGILPYLHTIMEYALKYTRGGIDVSKEI